MNFNDEMPEVKKVAELPKADIPFIYKGELSALAIITGDGMPVITTDTPLPETDDAPDINDQILKLYDLFKSTNNNDYLIHARMLTSHL
jgi:hypothetical protein